MTGERNPCQWMIDAVQKAGFSIPDVVCLSLPEETGELWQSMIENCGVTEYELADIVARHARLKVADLNNAEDHVLKLLPEKLARQNLVLPLREDDENLIVATGAPFDFNAAKILSFASGRTPLFEVAPPSRLAEAIESRYSPDRVVEGLLGNVEAQDADDVTVLEERSAEDLELAAVEAGPVVQLTSAILRDALSQGASDIHLEPSRIGAVIRFRVDGVMRHYMQMPVPALNRVLSRLKILARMDIADRLRPQDGRASVRVRGHSYDLRVSTVPTRSTEKMVIRVLDSAASISLDAIGVPHRELEQFRRMLSQRDSIVIMTGPTGSGKTTTLYAALQELATEEVNIITVEDPIEYELDGITQIQVQPQQGVTFASALRAILRQDPDIILLGEIRDTETAEIAVQASLTGHLVLATLHTNDSIGVITRLEDLDLDRTAIAESLQGALAQRLMRRVCDRCAERILEEDLTEDERRLADRCGVVPLVRAKGCEQCGQSGYRGRFAIWELWSSNGEMEELIAGGANISELRRAIARSGMRTLFDSALDKVREGITTLEEVERVLGAAGEAAPAVAEVPTAGNAVSPEPPVGITTLSEPTAEEEEAELKADADGALVLIVDDDPVNRKLARTLLEKNGFDVAEAEDGGAAVELLDLNPGFSLLVLDLDMPVMGGEDVLTHVRGSVGTAGLPVVILTGSEEQDTEVRLMAAGADDYIRKPLNPGKFMARVNAVLRRAGM